MYAIIALCFSNLVLLWVLIFASPDVFPPQGLLWVPIIFFMLFINSNFILCSFCSHILLKIFCADCWFDLVQLSANSWVKFSFVILEVLLCVLFYHVQVSFESLFFRQYLLIYFFQFYFQTCLLFSFDLFIPMYLSMFILLKYFCFLLLFLYLSLPHFTSRFCISIL